MIIRSLFRAAWRALAFASCAFFLRCATVRFDDGDGARWFRGDPEIASALAEEMIAFEIEDGASQKTGPHRFDGEWALVTHQMIALGLAQLCLAHPEMRAHYAPFATQAALSSFRPEMRTFGTVAWHEDAMTSLTTAHGHAYLAYPALALGMARLVDPSFPERVAAQHDALIAAYERRLLAARATGLIETYPGEAYPTDVAAVAAAIAVHGRVTGVNHARVLAQWADRVRAVQIDRATGFVVQRMGAEDGLRHDAPRGSGTALAAYFAGFADRTIAETLANGVFAHEKSFAGFGAIAEYDDGYTGRKLGDIDSGPVLFGVSVSATGFALAAARAQRRKDSFERIYRTTALFGMPWEHAHRFRFYSGGAIGKALMLALLTSGPEL